MSKLLQYFEKIISAMAIAALFAMVFLVFINVSLRYLFNSGLAWSEEVARLCFVWVVFFGIILAAKEKSHLTVDIILDILPPKISLILSYIIRFITIFIMIALMIGGVKLMALTYYQSLPASGLSTAYLYLAGVFGASVILLMTIYSLIKLPTNKEGEE